MSDEAVIKLRCGNDIARPDPSAGHLRVDIGQPIAPGVLSRLLQVLDKCPCGCVMAFLRDGEDDPWRQT